MAIYHLNAKVISRGKGKSSTAAAAYRAGDKIHDERLGKTFDYTRKQGVYATEILAPNDAPDWVYNRSKLWNAVELFETRSNSQVAREFDIALPVELSHDQKRSLVKTWVSDQFVNSGVVADVAFHDLNSQNPHVHILLTTRVIDSSGFGRKTREWDKKDFLFQVRESWADYTNEALLNAGTTERIDHRTLEEQGINRIPQIHLGPDVAAMMERGIATERSQAYLTIEATNREIEALEKQLTLLDETIRPIGEDELELLELELPNKSISTHRSDEQSSREREETPEPGITDLTAEFDRLTERLRSSGQQDRKPGKQTNPTVQPTEPAVSNLDDTASRLSQLAKRLKPTQERNAETTGVARSSVESQATTSQNRTDPAISPQIPTDADLAGRPHLHHKGSSEPVISDRNSRGTNSVANAPNSTPPAATPTKPNKRPSKQHRNPVRQDRKTVAQVTPTPKKQPSSQQKEVISPPNEEPEKQNNQLTDAELVALVRLFTQWEKTVPSPPDENKRKRLTEQFVAQEKELRKLSNSISTQKQFLSDNPPRSWKNPFGLDPDLYSSKEYDLSNSRYHYTNLQQKQKNTLSELANLSAEETKYNNWLSSPETQKMMELKKQLYSPELSERINQLMEVYQTYHNALTILEKRGVKTANKSYFAGNIYRVEKVDNTLTLTHKDKENPILVVTDNRDTGGIIDIIQCDLTDEDKKTMEKAAEYVSRPPIQQVQKHRGGLSR
ncbi:hypothetical protein PCC7424_5602 (plasmid) [Gloeothece citriformis PCC 7424]|uniref:MobA/MobL protein domain-containing protein n=1 Tax=Gloeothece citriformis (strain PCC 7424) TaxID=65393 RepID=B7KMY9_GLOC7|nr:MobQ family relaxase [Gloeothece citriformis]ACK74161.1 hypothetical protein PCC7424_5602 [Gloeothece citriformis PCC 7424]